MLWEDPNPWRAAWADRPDRGGLVPVEVPLGDLPESSLHDLHGALLGRRSARA